MSFKHVDSDTESNIRPEMNTEHTFTKNGDAKAHKPLVKDSIGDIREHGYVSRYISSCGKSPYNKPKRYENVEEEEIDLVPKRRAPPPPSHSASISSASIP